MTSNTPKVTICVPVRNGVLTIGRTLDSILAQDYSNFEIIVSDNCSTDETAKIIQGYAARGVRYYFNPQKNANAEDNWNHILQFAAGPLIALYHADDIYTSTIVRRQVEFLNIHTEASAVFAMMQTIDEQDRPIRMGSMRLPKELRDRFLFEFPEFFNAILKYRTFVPVPTMMTHRSVIDAVGIFRPQIFASASDIDLYLRMARQYGPIGVINEPLHKYRISNLQGSVVIANNRTTLFDFFSVIDAHLNIPEEKQVVEPQSLMFYELYRFSNLLTCVVNLLVQKNIAEARTRLSNAVKWRYFVTAVKRPSLFTRLVIGLWLLISIYLGLGVFMGWQMSWIRARRNAWLRMPI